MTTLREWVSRLLDLVRPRRADTDLEEELRLHVELATEEELTRSGSLVEARRAARIRVGGTAQALDAVRDQRGLPGLRDAVQDLRHAWRSLRTAPGFALMTVVTLGAGLGATATVFSAVDALLIRPLPVEAPHELFVVRRAGEPRTRFPLAFHRVLEESRTALDEPIAGFTFPVTLIASGTGTRARAAFVTPNYFRVLGVTPALGRSFQTDDDRGLIVISHRLWRERFGGRPSIVGEVVRVGDGAFVIGGVTPPGFSGLQLDIALDLWLPMSASPAAVPIPSFRPSVDIVGRLTAGVSREAAASQLNAAYGRWKESSSPPMPSPGSAPSLALIAASHGLESSVRGEFRASLGLLVGICACLWVIAIVNVSGLLAARLSERAREIGLRQVLGATSARLFVQLLTEVVVLISGGLLLGFLVTIALCSAIPTWVPAWAGIDIHLSPLVFAGTAITAALAAVVVTVVQAVSIDRRSLMSHLTPGLVRFSGRRFRLSTGLVAAQLALTLPLIVIAGLLARSLQHLGRVDTGFERGHLLQISVEPALVGYSVEQASTYYAALTERLRGVPGVADASVSSGGALSGYDGVARLRYDAGWQEVTTNAVDERYFGTMGIRLASGRAFQATEARGARGARGNAAVVVNDALARRWFGSSADAIGQVVTFDRGGAHEQRLIVGVVENTADASLRDRSRPTAYLPVADSSLLMVHVRSVADPAGLIAAVRQEVMSFDRRVPILGIETIEGRRRHALQRERLLAATSVAIGWVALALSAIGLFGRVNRDVVARRREIAIRAALGATPFRIAHLVLEETARMLVLSGVSGIGAAIAAAQIIKGQIYGVSGTDPVIYAGAAAMLVLVAAIATMLPLRRAWSAGASTHLLRV